jgi:hypothetical protein
VPAAPAKAAPSATPPAGEAPGLLALRTLASMLPAHAELSLTYSIARETHSVTPGLWCLTGAGARAPPPPPPLPPANFIRDALAAASPAASGAPAAPALADMFKELQKASRSNYVPRCPPFGPAYPCIALHACGHPAL